MLFFSVFFVSSYLPNIFFIRPQSAYNVACLVWAKGPEKFKEAPIKGAPKQQQQWWRQPGLLKPMPRRRPTSRTFRAPWSGGATDGIIINETNGGGEEKRGGHSTIHVIKAYIFFWRCVVCCIQFDFSLESISMYIFKWLPKDMQQVCSAWNIIG